MILRKKHSESLAKAVSLWYNIRMIEFYGEISLRNKQIADRLKKKYFAV